MILLSVSVCLLRFSNELNLMQIPEMESIRHLYSNWEFISGRYNHNRMSVFNYAMAYLSSVKAANGILKQTKYSIDFIVGMETFIFRPMCRSNEMNIRVRIKLI